MLAIKEKVPLSPEEMAGQLSITFFPADNCSQNKGLISFARKLKQALQKLGVNVISYDESLYTVPLHLVLWRMLRIILNNMCVILCNIFQIHSDRRPISWLLIRNLLIRQRIRKGISVVAIGEAREWHLPMDRTSSFTQNTIITILNKPVELSVDDTFAKHFATAMQLFTYHMTNIVILIDNEHWLLYNFNASHPHFLINAPGFEADVLNAVVPKIAASVKPLRLAEFVIARSHFDPLDELHKPSVDDLIYCGSTLEATGLYPKGMNLSEMPFRNGYYRWIGYIHTDNRNGMSYGFLARQLPTKIQTLVPCAGEMEGLKTGFHHDNTLLLMHNGALHLHFELGSTHYALRVPDVWVISQRSGCDKTNMQPQRDLVKIGLVGGTLHLVTPRGLKIGTGYRPSYDTRVILAHAFGNAVIASILRYFDPQSPFATMIEEKGAAITHWHGYINEEQLPSGFILHGLENPPVACSTPQSAIYALRGKLEAFEAFLSNGGHCNEYRGDIHVEPHHGTNMVLSSLEEFSHLVSNNQEFTALGNKFSPNLEKIESF